MARRFVKNTANFCSLGAAAIGPLLNGQPGATFACWVRPASLLGTTTDGDDVLLAWHSTNTAFGLRLSHSLTGVGDVAATLRRANGDSLHTFVSSTAISTSAWTHAVLAVTWGGAAKIYLNGVLVSGSVIGASTTTSGNFSHSSGSNHDCLGGAMSGSAIISTARQVDGDMADAALWSVELSANEIGSLAKGFTPRQVRPQSLRAYWPMIGRTTNEPDFVGGRNGTITGSLSAADHPRLYP